MFFEHKGVALKIVSENDLAVIASLRNDPSTWVNLTDPLPVFPADQKRWLESQSLRSGKSCFVASCPETEAFVGIARVDEYDMVNRSARVGADVMPELRGKGWGTKIHNAILRYLFWHVGLHRVWLQVLETNPRAAALYERLGYRIEGKLREAVLRGGRWGDYIVMSQLEDEWNPDA